MVTEAEADSRQQTASDPSPYPVDDLSGEIDAADAAEQAEAATLSSPPYYAGAAGERAFRLLRQGIQASLQAALRESHGKLFFVDTRNLYEAFYLYAFQDPAERQFHTCHCCRQFIERFGGLVTLDAEGRMKSAVWQEASLPEGTPRRYREVVRELELAVRGRLVMGQFLWKDLVWGTPEVGGFQHFHLTVATGFCSPELTPAQAMAEKKEDQKHLSIALGQWKPEHLQRAVAMLEAGGLIRPEKLLPMGRFLLQTQEKLQKPVASTEAQRESRRRKALWYAVATAARGWCTPRGSAFGALVEDIEQGLSVEAITRRHNEKMDPLCYQRPQAAPSEGNLRQAEKLFAQLGLAPSLRRRPLALEEAELFWAPPAPTLPAPEAGVFSHLRSGQQAKEGSKAQLSSKALTMTFAKFRRDVLPKVTSMLLHAPYRGEYFGLITAAVPEALPILQWDHEERRNPVNDYVYHGGSSAERWGLRAYSHVKVVGLSTRPSSWKRDEASAGVQEIVLVLLEGAGDRKPEGLSLFPEVLKSELHAVRSTIEAYSRAGQLEEETRAHAAGIVLSDHSPVTLTVHTEQGVALYQIDRLE